jgi:transcriptional regulator with XRE-family HTH domain
MSLLSNQELFAEWFAVPRELREPKTQKELAALLDVCPDTLSRWKKNPDFQAQVYKLALARLETALPDVLQVIIDNAIAGRFPFVKLLLELTEKYSRVITVESKEPKVGIEQYSDLIKHIEAWQEECSGERNDRSLHH